MCNAFHIQRKATSKSNKNILYRFSGQRNTARQWKLIRTKKTAMPLPGNQPTERLLVVRTSAWFDGIVFLKIMK